MLSFKKLIIIITLLTTGVVYAEKLSPLRATHELTTPDTPTNRAWMDEGRVPEALQLMFDTWASDGKELSRPGYNTEWMKFDELLRATMWRFAFIEYVRGVWFGEGLNIVEWLNQEVTSK